MSLPAPFKGPGGSADDSTLLKHKKGNDYELCPQDVT